MRRSTRLLCLVSLVLLGPSTSFGQRRLPAPQVPQDVVRLVTDVAELRALPAPGVNAARCVRLLGYRAPGDGGGGELYWAGTSTDPDDGGTTFAPDSNPATGRWKRLADGAPVSVAWFGAIPDDGKDDRAAIQAALDHCQVVVASAAPAPDFQVRSSLFVPRGTYLVSSAIRIRDGVDFFGSDASTTTLQHTGSGDLLRIVNDDLDGDGEPDPLYNVSVRRLTLRGNAGPLGENGLTRYGIYCFYGIRGCSLQDVVVTRCDTGIFLRRCYTVNVIGCTVMYCDQHCLKWENATAGMISGCRFDVRPRGSHCVFITFDHTNGQETLGLLVESSSFQGSALAGLYGRDVGNMTVVSCFFENNNRDDVGFGALHLEEVDGQPYDNEEHVVNVIGGFFSPGSGGGKSSRAIYVENTERVNLTGVDVRGSNFLYAIETGSKVGYVNLVGCKFHGRPRNIAPGVAVAEMGSD